MKEKKISCEHIEDWLQGKLSVEDSEAMEQAVQANSDLANMVADYSLALASIRCYSEQEMGEKIKRWDKKLPPAQAAPPPVPFSFTVWLLVLLFCTFGAGSHGSRSRPEKPTITPNPVPANFSQTMVQATTAQTRMPSLKASKRQHIRSKANLKAPIRLPVEQPYYTITGTGNIKNMWDLEDRVSTLGFWVDKKKRNYKDGNFEIVAFPPNYESGTWMREMFAPPENISSFCMSVKINKNYM
jgi:hypothetical protein